MYPFQSSRVKTYAPGDQITAAQMNAIQDGVVLLGGTAALTRPEYVDMHTGDTVDTPAPQPAWTLQNNLTQGAAWAPTAVGSFVQFQLPVAEGDVIHAIELSLDLGLGTAIDVELRARDTSTGTSASLLTSPGFTNTNGRSRYSLPLEKEVGTPGPYTVKTNELLWMQISNTVDIAAVLDQIVVRRERPVASGLVTAGDSGVGGGLILVDRQAVPAASTASSLTITGLNGDVDIGYHVEIEIRAPALDAATFFFLRPNGDDLDKTVARSIDYATSKTNPPRIGGGVSAASPVQWYWNGHLRAARTLEGEDFHRFATLYGHIQSGVAGTHSVSFFHSLVGWESAGKANMTSLSLDCTSDAAGSTPASKLQAGTSIAVFRYGTARSVA